VLNLPHAQGGSHEPQPWLRREGRVPVGAGLELTHRNLNDGSVEGFRHPEYRCFACSITRRRLPDRTTRPTSSRNSRECLRRIAERACLKTTSIRSILIVGSGPIVIGQACEFDYSGTQAWPGAAQGGVPGHPAEQQSRHDHDRPGGLGRHLHRAAHTEATRAIIARERPDALLPTLGGQTALNLAFRLAEDGTLEEFGVRLLGASARTIDLAEDRLKFKQACSRPAWTCPPPSS